MNDELHDEMAELDETLRQEAEHLGQELASNIQGYSETRSTEHLEGLIGFVHLMISRGIEEVALTLTSRVLDLFDPALDSKDIIRDRPLITDCLTRSQFQEQGALIIDLLGELDGYYGRWSLAADAFTTASKMFETLSMYEKSAEALQGLAGVKFHKNDLSAAVDAAREALRRIEKESNSALRLNLLLNLAQYYVSLEDLDQLDKVLDDLREIPNLSKRPHELAAYRGFVAMAHVLRGQFDEAEPLLLSALRSAERRGDVPQAQYLSQNLGNVLDSLDNLRRSLYFRKKSLGYALSIGDPEMVSDLRHAIALTHARRNEIGAALDQLQQAVQLGRETGELGILAEGLADLGAVQMVAFTGMRLNVGSDEGSKEVVAKKRRSLSLDPNELQTVAGWFIEAVEIFASIQDERWLVRVAGNLLNLRIQTAELGVARQEQESIAHELEKFAPGAAAIVLRDLAQTLMNYESNARAAADLLRHASSLNSLAGSTSLGWNLAESAAEVADYGIFHEEAEALFEEAERALVESGDPLGAATVANDRAVVLAKVGRVDDSLRLLETVIQLARHDSNRVLEQMALSNLGVVSADAGRDQSAARHYATAAVLASDLGDHEGAADMWHRVAASHLNSMELDATEEALERAHIEAEIDGGDFARAVVLAGRAMSQFQKGNVDVAERLWINAANLSAPRDQIQYFAFALEARASRGLDAGFESLLRTVVDVSNREGLQQFTAHLLWRPALVWLRSGDVQQAAEAFASALALAARRYEGASEGRASVSIRTMLPLLQIMTEVNTVLNLPDIPINVAAECRMVIESKLAVNGGKRAAREIMAALAATSQGDEGLRPEP
ncbi:tetratricopeptide repeat protein [Arthrobacter ruber]|uniref:tetratricopeptide repeat protein n=1 Tax=Arthrobacter ruber TaxID=1258893 RepID=UPI0013000403|nr:tetratricopeptide repeat protein [Arthrobacter ruber]